MVGGKPKKFISGHNGVGRRRVRYVSFTCDHCSVVFECEPSAGRRRFCSTACRDEYRRRQTGEDHPQYLRVEVVCARCETVFTLIPSRVKRRGKHYCSAACGNAARSEGLSKRQSAIRQRFMSAAKKRDGAKCRICGFDLAVEVHHILPRSAGGTHELSNLITLCPNHHAMVHRGIVSQDELRAIVSRI